MLDFQIQGLDRIPSPLNEKDEIFIEEESENPVVESAEFVCKVRRHQPSLSRLTTEITVFSDLISSRLTRKVYLLLLNM